MFKSTLSILAVVLAAVSSIEASKDLTGKELELAFEQLEKFLNEKKALNEFRAALAAAKGAQSTSGLPETRLQQAAEYFVYLNEFENCSPKAIEYMNHLLHGRPSGEALLSDSPLSKGPLDRFVESTLVRASGKCKSFLEEWFKVSQMALDDHKKSLLFDFLTPESIKVGAYHYLDDMLVSAVTKEGSSLAKQVAYMKEDELRRLFASYVVANLVEPCKSYVESMAAVIKAAQQFGVGRQKRRAKLFDEPSEEFVDAVQRYEECKFSAGFTGRNIDRYAREAATKMLAN